VRACAAVDLGAESGRVMWVGWDGQRLTWQQVHRFPTRAVEVAGHLLWDILAMWEDVLHGLSRARQVAGHLDSLGVDTWAVDYALVDTLGLPMTPVYHYRDARTQGIPQKVWLYVSQDELYRRSGIQFLPFNTLYQLVAQHAQEPRILEIAHRLLLVPDLLHAWLTGILVSERTNATTTQMWSVHKEEGWLRDVLDRLSLPGHILPTVVEPGTVLGPTLPSVAERLGETVAVVVPATHDTASAVAAVPALPGEHWAFVSAGTWSLVGAELFQPLVGPQSQKANFTNEGGVGDTIRFLRNVTGFWVLAQCRQAWASQGRPWRAQELVDMALASPPTPMVVDPDDASFERPGDMPARVADYLRRHGWQPPAEEGPLVRAILQGMVLRHRRVLLTLQALTGQKVEVLHLVGGGAANAAFAQWLADATGLVVHAGPQEATALGNALVQLMALGEIASLEEGRALVRSSSPPRVYEPDPSRHAWWEELDALLPPRP
jgi:rhamnulokinase